MVNARTDWKEHTAEDFGKLEERVKTFGLHLLGLFKDTPYSVIWADDYSSQPLTASDNEKRR